jgi:hypothetical protein
MNTPLENLTGCIQLLDTKAILLALSGEADIALLLREEIANRGMGSDGRWIGFAAAKELWLKPKAKRARKIQTYPTVINGRAARVTVPQD